MSVSQQSVDNKYKMLYFFVKGKSRKGRLKGLENGENYH